MIDLVLICAGLLILAINLAAGLAIAPIAKGLISSARGQGFKPGYLEGVQMIKGQW